MATTSLWRIKGQLGNVIRYIENPEKTSVLDCEGKDAVIEDVIDYVTRDSATQNSNLVIVSR